MAWMSDEKYTYVQDCKEKKITARSAHHARTHCGKGGRVKFPSDFMSKKEIKAMSGKCVSYPMNKPMSWNEFMELPDDLKQLYIQSLRNKYDVPDEYLAKMFDVSRGQLGLYIKDLKLDIKLEKGEWNKESFLAWSHGADPDLVKEAVSVEEDVTVVENKNVYDRNPITWEQFRGLSDDEKRVYIAWVRETFKAPDKYISESMGVHYTTLNKVIKALGCSLGKNSSIAKCKKWPREEFIAWFKGEAAVDTVDVEPVVPVEEIPVEPANEPIEIPVGDVTPTLDILDTPAIGIGTIIEKPTAACKFAVPTSGQMSFESTADLALNTIMQLLGSAHVKLTVSWDVIPEEVVGK